MKKRSFIQHQLNSIILSAVLLFSFFQPVSAFQTGDAPPPPSAPEEGGFKLLFPPGHHLSKLLPSRTWRSPRAYRNLYSPVQLVSGKSTLVRVYGRTLTSSIISGFSATLVGYRGSTYLGALGPVTGSIYPSSVSLDAMRADKAKTFNFQLPPSWVNTSGTLNLTVSLGVSTLAPEQNGSDLSYSRSFSLINVLPSTLWLFRLKSTILGLDLWASRNRICQRCTPAYVSARNGECHGPRTF